MTRPIAADAGRRERSEVATARLDIVAHPQSPDDLSSCWLCRIGRTSNVCQAPHRRGKLLSDK